MGRTRDILGMFKDALWDFFGDECPSNAAALAYYTVFSLPPLLALLILLAGLIWDPADVQGAIEYQIRDLIGKDGAREVRTMIAHEDPTGGRGPLATVAGMAMLIFGAGGAFLQLQSSLNKAWEVAPDPAQNQIKNFFLKRVFSFGLILGLAFLMMVSLALTAAISAVGKYFGGGLPEEVLFVIDFLLAFSTVTVLFAAMFKFLPDARIAWRDVWVGALVTGSLFVLGKFVLGYYLGRSNPGGAFGAAASLAIILIWVYYASMIVLFGAELTQQWVVRYGGGIRPEKGATLLVEKKERIRTVDSVRE